MPVDQQPEPGEVPLSVRREAARAARSAVTAAAAATTGLGIWCGNGAYEQLSEATRTRAGQRALSDLDTARAQLDQAREQLAALVGPPAPALPADTRPLPDLTVYDQLLTRTPEPGASATSG